MKAFKLLLILATAFLLASCELTQYRFMALSINPLSQQLTKAASTGNISEVDRLISLGAPLQDPYPMQAAVLNRQYNMAQHLVERGTPVNGNGTIQSPLWFAVANGDTQMSELLVTLGADVNWQIESHGTPLHAALYSLSAEENRLALAQLLVEHNADVNAIQNDEMFRKQCLATPLHAAVFSSQEALVKLLLSHGADQTATDKSGRTPLKCARERLQVIKAYDLMDRVEKIVVILEAEQAHSR